MADYTIRNLKHDVEDMASKFPGLVERLAIEPDEGRPRSR
jgi:hypothetical protein